jgi:hypothetical protein
MFTLKAKPKHRLITAHLKEVTVCEIEDEAELGKLNDFDTINILNE